MDGITMLERVEKFLPDSVPIFMSGYSDKEYLKAAIKLKAVNYIEKPLNPVEIQAAVKDFHDQVEQLISSEKSQAFRFILIFPALPCGCFRMNSQTPSDPVWRKLWS